MMPGFPCGRCGPRSAPPFPSPVIGQAGDARAQRLRGGRVVAVAFHLQDGRWLTIRTRMAPASRRIGRLLLGQTVLLFGILFGPLMFIAWRVSRPLARLADAAGDVRLAGGAPIPETGPEDVRLLTRAFNAMRGRIGGMLAEKDRMLGAIGHDLRTPLSSLRVRAELVADARLRDGMIASIEDMAAMLDDILALARAGHPREGLRASIWWRCLRRWRRSIRRWAARLPSPQGEREMRRRRWCGGCMRAPSSGRCATLSTMRWPMAHAPS